MVLEILNSTANFDIDRMWVNSWRFFTRNGDIYVGIASAPYQGEDGDPQDYPYEVIFNAAFHHLYIWAKEGILAPHAPKFKTQVVFGESTDPMGSYIDNCRDLFGNCIGGIRTPAIDFPTGTYASYSTRKDGTINPMFGKVNPFSSDLINRFYQKLVLTILRLLSQTD